MLLKLTGNQLPRKAAQKAWAVCPSVDALLFVACVHCAFMTRLRLLVDSETCCIHLNRPTAPGDGANAEAALDQAACGRAFAEEEKDDDAELLGEDEEAEESEGGEQDKCEGDDKDDEDDADGETAQDPTCE